MNERHDGYLMTFLFDTALVYTYRVDPKRLGIIRVAEMTKCRPEVLPDMHGAPVDLDMFWFSLVTPSI
jgi:hypothetical protein